MRFDILHADLSYLSLHSGALNLSGSFLVGTYTVQLHKLQVKHTEGGLEKLEQHGSCEKINHLNLAVAQIFQHSEVSSLDKNIQETKLI